MHHVREQLGFTEPIVATGRGVRVAVLDTGIDASHADVGGQFDVAASRSFAERADLEDRNGHGTHIAGIIGGTGKASGGLYRGLAPECDLIVYKIANQRRALEGNAIAAIEAAIDARADIINYSHGFVPSSDVHPPPWLWPRSHALIEHAFQLASEAGILCVVAAGNCGPNEGSITRPGGLPCVLTVGSVDRRHRPLPASGQGPFRRSESVRIGDVVRYDRFLHLTVEEYRKPDVVAPGVVCAARAIDSPYDDTTDERDPLYTTMNGTSQATAVVSGLAALLLELVARNGVDLGPSRARTLHRLFRHAAIPTREGDAGTGIPIWPNLVGVLRDFASDPSYRTQVLHDGLELM